MKKFILLIMVFIVVSVFAASPISASGIAEDAPVLSVRPRMLSAVSAGYDAVTAAWEAVPGAQSYTLYYKGGTVGEWTIVEQGITDTSYTHRSSESCPLTTGVRYFYKVRALVGNTLSDFSSNRKGAKPVLGKTEITGVTSVSYNRIKIRWRTVEGASAYRIYRRENGVWKYIGQTASLYYIHTSSQKHPIHTGVTYSYRVRAVRKTEDTIVFGGFDDAQGVKVKTVPEKAVLLKVSSGDVFGKITIQWKASPGATGYKVYRRTSGAKKWQKIAGVQGGTVTSYVHEDSEKFPIRPDKTYYYTVRAYTSSGNTYGAYDTRGLSVKIPPAADVTDAQLRQKAREVVNKITTPDMTKQQKLVACFNYVRSGTWSRSLFPDRTRKNWKYKCAMDELITRQHNCYGFSHSFAALAREVGYTPYIIEIPLYHCFVQIDGKYWDNLGWLMGSSTPSKPYTAEQKTKF